MNSTETTAMSETKTISIRTTAVTWPRFKRYAGVGLLVAVGYMDPGNWATDIEAGSRYGYQLLFVVALSSLIAMVLQAFCVRLGVATGRDIAQLCRERFSRGTNLSLWFLAEIAIIACDFAEVLGTALALKLLFGMPLAHGIVLTALDTVIVLALQDRSTLSIEKLVAWLIGIIAVVFTIELLLTQPDWGAVAGGMIPTSQLFYDPHMALIAVGILGATVMPHNLFLHSSAVSTHRRRIKSVEKTEAIRYMTYDSNASLTLAFLINAAILVLAGSALHTNGYMQVKEIDEAYYLLAPLLGTAAASILFALALFASGQSSTLTGTMAGQIIFQGFLNLRIPAWQQRLITRTLAIIPALLGVLILGEDALGKLLVISQVVLSMQLPFAIVPLLLFCSNKELMGQWRLKPAMQYAGWMIFTVIASANLFLLYQIFIT